MLTYRIDVLRSLADKGYTTYRLRKDKLLPDSIIQYLRHGRMVGIGTIDTLCRLLDCQPGDILQYDP